MATKQMTKRKVRKYSDGGETIDDTKTVDQVKAEQSDDPIGTLARLRGGDTEEGGNANIGDDTRARAMAWLARQNESKPAAKAKAPYAGRGSVNPDRVVPSESESNRSALNKSESYRRTDYSRPEEEPGLENLSADFIAGPAKLALAGVGGVGGLMAAAKMFAKARAGQAAETAVKRGSPEIGYETAKRITTTVGKGKELPAPPRALPGPKAAEKAAEDTGRKFIETPNKGATKPGTFKRTKPEAEVSSAGRESVTNKASWANGPKGELGRDKVMDREAWAAGPRGELGKKKGGSIKAFAKGGSVRGWGKARGARAAKIV